jgi:hypothetical protein
MENAFQEMGELRDAIQRLEYNDEFLKAALIHQLYVELHNRFNGLPVEDFRKG